MRIKTIIVVVILMIFIVGCTDKKVEKEGLGNKTIIKEEKEEQSNISQTDINQILENELIEENGEEKEPEVIPKIILKSNRQSFDLAPES
jgi:hypothetical protein